MCYEFKFAMSNHIEQLQTKTPMKKNTILLLSFLTCMACNTKKAEPIVEAAVPVEIVETKKMLFLDVHNLEPGKVTFAAVADAHKKDLATQGKYDVNFIKYWVDEKAGKVYCLSEAKDSASVYHTHAEAHGLVPDMVQQVSGGTEASITDYTKLYFDIHHLGAGKVTAAGVADAHVKDLAVQGKYNVNFVNYWVDEKLGIVMCLAETPDEKSMIAVHKEAHGLIPDEVHKVQEGH